MGCVGRHGDWRRAQRRKGTFEQRPGSAIYTDGCQGRVALF